MQYKYIYRKCSLNIANEKDKVDLFNPTFYKLHSSTQTILFDKFYSGWFATQRDSCWCVCLCLCIALRYSNRIVNSQIQWWFVFQAKSTFSFPCALTVIPRKFTLSVSLTLPSVSFQCRFSMLSKSNSQKPKIFSNYSLFSYRWKVILPLDEYARDVLWPNCK